MVDFVEICKVCARKAIIKGVKRINNSDKVCRSYSDLNFGVTFLEHSVDCLPKSLYKKSYAVQKMVRFLAHPVYIRD